MQPSALQYNVVQRSAGHCRAAHGNVVQCNVLQGITRREREDWNAALGNGSWAGNQSSMFGPRLFLIPRFLPPFYVDLEFFYVPGYFYLPKFLENVQIQHVCRKPLARQP